jgi:hypothetical protein
MSRECAWDDCHRPVRAPFHLCPTHWIRLPKEVREGIGRLDFAQGDLLVMGIDPSSAAAQGALVWGVRRHGTLMILGMYSV